MRQEEGKHQRRRFAGLKTHHLLVLRKDVEIEEEMPADDVQGGGHPFN